LKRYPAANLVSETLVTILPPYDIFEASTATGIPGSFHTGFGRTTASRKEKLLKGTNTSPMKSVSSRRTLPASEPEYERLSKITSPALK
jgi:hypothetical protein